MVENYYAFGQPLPKWNSKTTDAPFYDPTKYRYGFNGKEDDDEWSKQDYGFRIYDGRIGRFLSVDPLTGSYPWYTPYQFAGNKPIRYIDRDGAEEDDPDPSYQNSVGRITDQAATDNTELTKDKRVQLVDITNRALLWANEEQEGGHFLAARNMRRYLEGKGGYDIYSYHTLDNYDMFKSLNDDTNTLLSAEIKNQIRERGDAPAIVKQNSEFTVNIEHTQGQFIMGGDFENAFGTSNLLVSAEVHEDGKNEVFGTAYFVFRDNYVWRDGKVTMASLTSKWGGTPSHSELFSLREVGSSNFSVRAYFTAEFASYNDAFGHIQIHYYNFQDSPRTDRHPREQSDRYQFLEPSPSLIYNFNKKQ
jgi:RHS repeat-associated protein